MADELSRRSTQEVIDDHLRLATENDVEADLERNVAEDIVVLSGRGIFHGHGRRRQPGSRHCRALGAHPRGCCSSRGCRPRRGGRHWC